MKQRVGYKMHKGAMQSDVDCTFHDGRMRLDGGARSRDDRRVDSSFRLRFMIFCLRAIFSHFDLFCKRL